MPKTNRNRKRRQRFITKHGKCKRCETPKDLTVDHIIARGLGGANTQDNWQVLCASCNIEKSKKESRDINHFNQLFGLKHHRTLAQMSNQELLDLRDNKEEEIIIYSIDPTKYKRKHINKSSRSITAITIELMVRLSSGIIPYRDLVLQE